LSAVSEDFYPCICIRIRPHVQEQASPGTAATGDPLGLRWEAFDLFPFSFHLFFRKKSLTFRLQSSPRMPSTMSIRWLCLGSSRT